MTNENILRLPSLRLLSAVLRASEVESRASRASLTELLSPQMGKDIMWFLRRWAKTYLLVDEKLYEQVGAFLTLVPHLSSGQTRSLASPHPTCPSSDQHSTQHSVWCGHRGSPVDCGISLGEGGQQSVSVERRGGAFQRHGGAVGDVGGEEGKVGAVRFPLTWTFPLMTLGNYDDLFCFFCLFFQGEHRGPV